MYARVGEEKESSQVSRQTRQEMDESLEKLELLFFACYGAIFGWAAVLA